MNTKLKKILSSVLVAVMLMTSIPTAVYAAGTGADNPEKLELSDEYVKVTVSGKNGGFLIDTLEGDKLEKADNNKFLLYPAEEYDTSYTSIRVTRKNGDVEDYIFGRKYGFLWLEGRDISLVKEGNSIVASWSVKDITVEQSLTLLDEMASQHGMVGISYKVSTTSDDVENIKLRIMLDTALGYQDYGTYQVPNSLNEYTTVVGEKIIDTKGGIEYNGTMFAIDDAKSPNISAYTTDAAVGSEKVMPYQIAFGHWNNLASSVFDFIPNEELDFTNPYNIDYMTADSAYALYYDMGAVAQNGEATIATYYGVFSNSTVSEEEGVAINFTSLPTNMEFNGDKTAYLPQVGDKNGDVKLQMSIENISGSDLSGVSVVIKSQNGVVPYSNWQLDLSYGSESDYSTYISDFVAGEEALIDVYYNISPIQVSEYRRFEVIVQDGSKVLGSREFYLFCPGVLGEVVAFNSIDPQVIYSEGTRQLFLSGNNFSLMADPTAYATVFRPVAGGDDVIIPSKDVVVDPGTNTMYIIVEQEMIPGAYQVIFDWNEAGKEDTTAQLLQFQVSSKPEVMSPIYGLVTVEKDDGFTERNPKYKVGIYETEADYRAKVKDPNNQVYLEIRGNFGVRYDENGNPVEMKATSIADIEGKITNTINISNCLDIEDGYLAVIVNNPGTDDQSIDVNIDGRVYTTNSRTKVWNGVCAITSFENGELSSLLQYKSDGSQTTDVENSVTNTNAITLLWPGAASDAQTLAGIVFEFRYCQFGMMATEHGDVTDSTPKKRVISFGAEMSPSFLLPKNYDHKRTQTSPLDVVQYALAKKNYTASQLREVRSSLAADQRAWEIAQRGTLNLNVSNILFGGGFIGFNASIEVGIPEYFSGIPSIGGVLDLKILPAAGYWEVGVEGQASFLTVIKVEAALTLMKVDGVSPGVDKVYFYCEGNYPGINVDGVGVFWVRGMGGGLDGMYKSLYIQSAVPPISLLFSGKFAIFSAFEARADLTIGARGFEIELSELGILGIELIERLGISAYWYPEFKFRGSINVDILDIILGAGYIVIEEDRRNDSIFWEGFVTARLQTPDLPLIGSITIGQADLGLNTNKIWGALHVIGIDMGITYYWGGDVDFGFGKYDAPEPTYPISLQSIPVSVNEQTGQILYMSVGTNAVLAAEAIIAPQSDTQKVITDKAEVTSTVDRMSHTVKLGGFKGNSDMALSVTFEAQTLEEAQAIAYGGKNGKSGIRLTAADDDSEYELKWIDNSVDADKQTDANALLSYNEETKQAHATITFTEKEAYSHNWLLSANAPADLALYEMEHMAGLDSADYSYEAGNMTVNWQGSMLEDIDSLAVYAIGEDDEVYTLYQTEDTAVIAGGMANATKGMATFEIPADLPSGSYTVKVVASSEANSINDIAQAEGKFDYVNPNQPADPEFGGVKLGGDYSIDVNIAAKDDYEGYVVTVYEKQTADGEVSWIETELGNQWIEADENGTLPETIVAGGRYTNTVYTDSDGNVLSAAEAEKAENVTETTEEIGLEAGKTYRVGVTAHKTDANGNTLFSEEVFSDEIEMKAPVAPKLNIRAQKAKYIEDISMVSATVDTVNESKVVVDVSSDMPVSGTWSLDDGAEKGEFKAENSAQIILGGEEGLAEGEHTLTVYGETENGDAFSKHYRFKVDITAPRLQFSSPHNGAFFAGTVTVAGISEPKSAVYFYLDNMLFKSIEVDENGEFNVGIAMDTSKLEQTVSVYAKDLAGNETRTYEMQLTNSIIGEFGSEFAIFLNGTDYTNKTIPAGAGGMLELRAVSGDRNVVIPANSIIGRQAEWSVTTVEGTASISNMQLVTDNDVNGIITVELDKQSVAAVLGGNEALEDSVYEIVLPENGVGYTINTQDETTVKYGSDFSFTVDLADGYSKTANFAVKVNGVEIEPTNGVYTISSVTAKKTVTVAGVADITAPEAEIQISEHKFNSFLNTITFERFFKQTQKATVAATDAGSGMDAVYYIVSDKALTVDEVKAAEWTEYDGAINLNPDLKAVIYIKAVDKAGNVGYISSDGLVLDSTVPVITGIEDGKTYYGELTASVQDDNLDKVLVDGEEIETTDGSFAIVPDNKEHTVEVTDKAGNSISYIFSVYETYAVKFVVDNEVYKTVTVNYGDDLAASEFPVIPEKTGYTNIPPVWEPDSLENIKEDKVVRAVYTPDVCKVILPDNAIGYEVNTEQETEVTYGQPFSFTVDTTEGYSKTDKFKVYVNRTEISSINGVYTIAQVQSDIVITVEGVADITAPEIEIQVKDSIWNSFLNTITFNHFFKETQKAKITAADSGSGVNKVYYYLSERMMSLDDVKAAEWIEYTDTVKLDPEQIVVVYVKAVDNAGNASYISSDGLVFDNTSPVITGIEDGGVYEGAVTVTVDDDNVSKITVNDTVVYDSQTAEDESMGRQFTVNPAEGEQIVTVIDKAGNEISVTVTVYEEYDISDVVTGINGFDKNRVTIFWEDDINYLIAQIDELLARPAISNEKTELLEAYRAQAEELIEIINNPVEYFSFRLFYFIWDCLTWKYNGILNAFGLIFGC
ncbi:MAG: hypothetical protein IJA02_10015 [Clostridia bacterium]|nr:hypothetical protein [Clostridia bacterium]